MMCMHFLRLDLHAMQCENNVVGGIVDSVQRLRRGVHRDSPDEGAGGGRKDFLLADILFEFLQLRIGNATKCILKVNL